MTGFTRAGDNGRLKLAVPAKGRMAEPAEVAALAAYFAGEEAGYVTGEVVAIDGGMSLNTFSLTAKQRG